MTERRIEIDTQTDNEQEKRRGLRDGGGGEGA